MDGQAGHVVQLRLVPCNVLLAIAQARFDHGIRVLLVANPPQQRIRFQPAALASRARRVRAIARQQHADMHLVGLRLQPVEVMLHAIPRARPGLLPARPLRLAVDDPALLRRTQRAPWLVERDAALLRVLQQVVLAFLEALRLPRLDRTTPQGLRLVGNDQAVIHADDSTESATGVTSTDRRIERERALARLAIVDIAVGAVKVAAVPPGSGDR